jgi:DNA-directed RNA polymerase subunit K/omega
MQKYDNIQKYDIDILSQKVGGPFRLAVLVQKRVKDLKKGAPKLVTLESKRLLDIVFQEIMEDKLKLVVLPEEDEEAEVKNTVDNTVLFEETYQDEPHRNEKIEFQEDENSDNSLAEIPSKDSLDVASE